MNILYPGSFNPFHKGHLDILRKIRKMFPNANIHLGKFINESKIDFSNTLKINTEAFSLANTVSTSTRFIDEYCKEHHIDIVIRGMRTYEDPKEDLEWIKYVKQNTKCEILYIQSELSNMQISSTKIREKDNYESEKSKKIT